MAKEKVKWVTLKIDRRHQDSVRQNLACRWFSWFKLRSLLYYPTNSQQVRNSFSVLTFDNEKLYLSTIRIRTRWRSNARTMLINRRVTTLTWSKWIFIRNELIKVDDHSYRVESSQIRRGSKFFLIVHFIGLSMSEWEFCWLSEEQFNDHQTRSIWFLIHRELKWTSLITRSSTLSLDNNETGLLCLNRTIIQWPVIRWDW